MVNARQYPFTQLRTAESPTGETLRLPGRFEWEEDEAPDTLAIWGLSPPQLLPATTNNLLMAGLANLEEEFLPPHIVAFPQPEWSEQVQSYQARRRQRGLSTVRRSVVSMFPTQRGIKATPKDPPLPWVPTRGFIVKSEAERELVIRDATRRCSQR